MEQNDLSGVKVGNKLYHMRYGECEVVGMDIGQTYPIIIKARGMNTSFTFSGKENQHDFLPTLFRLKPTIIYPPSPVVKVVEGWVGFNISDNGSIFTLVNFFRTEVEANYYASNDPSIPRAVFVSHKYRKED